MDVPRSMDVQLGQGEGAWRGGWRGWRAGRGVPVGVRFSRHASGTSPVASSTHARQQVTGQTPSTGPCCVAGDAVVI